jgi:predicted RNase H-like nuclease (RuvC/YqgF family)
LEFARCIGIDPGRKDAMAVLDERGQLLPVTDACSADELGVLDIAPVLTNALSHGKAMVVVERPL